MTLWITACSPDTHVGQSQDDHPTPVSQSPDTHDAITRHQRRDYPTPASTHQYKTIHDQPSTIQISSLLTPQRLSTAPRRGARS